MKAKEFTKPLEEKKKKKRKRDSRNISRLPR